jgi:hypothetical protein
VSTGKTKKPRSFTFEAFRASDLTFEMLTLFFNLPPIRKMLIPLRPRHHHAHLAIFDVEPFDELPFNPVPLDLVADYQGADAVEVRAAGFVVLLTYRANHKV